MPKTNHQASIRLTHAQRKVVAELLPRLSDHLLLDRPSTRTVFLPLNQIKEIEQAARKAIPNAENGMKRNSLRHIVDAANQAIDDSQSIKAIPAAERLYQFKITLKGTQPPIWRRIQVRNCTLDRLHELIQMSMGWTNSHLHQFEIDGDRYGDPELLECGEPDHDYIDSTVTKISEIVPQDGKRFRFDYEYDFGDGWEHEVLFEGCLRAEKGVRYPLCLEGERCCPPEDVGGIWGYTEFLEAIADPQHEEHERLLEWAGPFDPEAFSAEKATKVMRRGLPDWRMVE